LTKIEKDAQWEEIFTILIFCSLVRRKREGVGEWAWLGTSGQKNTRLPVQQPTPVFVDKQRYSIHTRQKTKLNEQKLVHEDSM